MMKSGFALALSSIMEFLWNLIMNFFNASRNEICTTAYSRHCFLKDGKLIALKKELPELNRIITDCL